MSLVLGYSYASLEVRNASGRVFTVNFPMTSLSGRQVETYDIEGWEAKQVNLAILPSQVQRGLLQGVYGFWINWTFNYPDRLQGSDAVNFARVIEAALTDDSGSSTMYLTPRVDEDWRIFQVVLSLEQFSLGISKGGSLAKFNRDFVIRFKTKNMERSLKWSLTTADPVLCYINNFNNAFMRVVG